MTIIVTGGGSGGHITPVLAVAAALKQHDATIKVVFLGQRGDRLADIPAKDPNIDAVFTVRAGKYRRYHGLGWRQYFDFKTLVLNIRDIGYIGLGWLQSIRLMRQLQPDIIFTRGGFVSVPVALAGKLCGVPYVTHDSDSTPSLANRLIARGAAVHLVALPKDLYPYPAAKTVVVGIPISDDYQFVTPQLQLSYRKALRLPATSPVLLVTGGGNGAQRLNEFILQNTPRLLARFKDLTIIHIAGRAHEADMQTAYDQLLTNDAQRSRVQVLGYITGLHRYSGAADIVIARGGATNMAEFAAQAKTCIIVPSPQLIWNVKNVRSLRDQQAIAELSEDHAEQEGRLAQLVTELLSDKPRAKALAQALHGLAKTDAAELIVQQLLQYAKQRQS